MALIACVGSFTGGAFRVEGGGSLNPSIKDKKRHICVHKGSELQGWACQPPRGPSPLQHTCIACSFAMVGSKVECDLTCTRWSLTGNKKCSVTKFSQKSLPGTPYVQPLVPSLPALHAQLKKNESNVFSSSNAVA